MSDHTGDSGLTEVKSGNLLFGGEEELKSFRHREDGKIEIVLIRHPKISTWPETPKTAIKKIYEAKDGQIILADEIKGKVIPPKTIPEKIEWEEQ